MNDFLTSSDTTKGVLLWSIMMRSELARVRFVFVCNFFLAIAKCNRAFVGEINYNKVLTGYVIDSMYTKDMFVCSHKCIENSKCGSINFEIQSEKMSQCELNREVGRSKMHLRKKRGFVFVLSLRTVQVAKSCLEHYKLGMATSGIYRIQGNRGKVYKAYCDMTSEQNSAWTLVLSYSYQNASNFRKSLRQNYPVGVNNPNWNHYRLSKRAMEDLRKGSTHWRITCSFPDFGVDYKDYLRASFLDFDPLIFNSNHGNCKNVELISIGNNKCRDCTASFKQSLKALLYHSRDDACNYGTIVDQSDNYKEYFGNYKLENDVSFRCTSGLEKTTNMWFGGYV